jgi:hypothetical protein
MKIKGLNDIIIKLIINSLVKHSFIRLMTFINHKHTENITYIQYNTLFSYFIIILIVFSLNSRVIVLIFSLVGQGFIQEGVLSIELYIGIGLIKCYIDLNRMSLFKCFGVITYFGDLDETEYR